MVIYYHGTIVKNLSELKPFASPHSNLKYPCVYLSANKAMAAIYIWNKPFKWMSFHVQDDGIPVITESFPNHIHEFYNGVSGCIYIALLADLNATIYLQILKNESLTANAGGLSFLNRDNWNKCTLFYLSVLFLLI